MSSARRRATRVALSAALPALLLFNAIPGHAAPADPTPGAVITDGSALPPFGPEAFGDEDGGEGGSESADILAADAAYSAVRTAPGTTVSSEALAAGRQSANGMPTSAGRWSEFSSAPYNTADHSYELGPHMAGHGVASGRITSLAVDGQYLYAGAAGGGVWRSTDQGAHWSPVFDQQDTLSIGAVAVNPADHSLWVGTGEANSNADGIAGGGIYRSTDHGQTFQLVGNRVANSMVFRISFAENNQVYVATNQGLLKHPSKQIRSPWQTVLKPDPNPTGSPYRTSFVTDVRVRPGSHGQTVVAALGWRGGTKADDLQYNGFYVSNDAGATWTKATPGGDLDASRFGRTTFDWTPDGSKLYAVVEDPTNVSLGGVFSADSGDINGSWTKLADAAKLKASGGRAGTPGAQAWYDQYVTVDPADPNHVYLGLEDIYETSDGGKSWDTIGPYWNYDLPCYDDDPAKNTCPNTTHPDQHAAVVAPDGTAYFGNDGGVWSRPAALRKVVQWTDRNATLRTLQYFYGGLGASPDGKGDIAWGGLQDNGYSVLTPGSDHMAEPKGGDGFDVVVDPKNGNRVVAEYTNLAMAKSDDGGHSWYYVTPNCKQNKTSPCETDGRFNAPFSADPGNADHWVAGGRYVWDNQGKGWDTTCWQQVCDWKPVRDLGAGNASTAVAVSGSTTYVGWCGTGNGCNPGAATPFTSGIDTNYGGTWHRISAPELPNRFVTGLTVDPADAGHVYAVYGSYSRHWIDGAGVGHVFESRDGGAHWTDISGNLPDAPFSVVKLWKGQVVVGGDVGVFVADGSGCWRRLGTGLPNASVSDLTVSPDGSYLMAATHGRGLWKITG
ncbi:MULTISPECIES: WD40/YVTN/BNR-like repeat-containing protein [Kitasatospora]|uniref:Glycosyl hydrolase n=1 Tax=Kitasatospora cathayae TaxID=3004092 RepID=A0ABY7Q1L3_9ACTN|nr:glycosyl hydrolase [Kitasatospora sp. HUAS 3-15]WBP86349.1 glycosyl hydrolase [Kitasatospora sp. HUAS 3-15]